MSGGTGAGGGVLHLVGTPIGNLGDLPPRAREVLAAVDLIACEDTRRTGSMLAHFAIATPTRSFFEANEHERTPELLRVLREGRDVALVSDAGMPGVSDPGYRLVAACAREGIEVKVVPGPSAALAALVVSGLPTDRFSFEGFLPRRAGDRTNRLETLADDPRTLVFFESPRRVIATLDALLAALGDRPAAIARELTKLHEEVVRGSLSELRAAMEARGELRGEVVLVVGGAAPPPPPPLEDLLEEARALVAAGRRKREAAQEVAGRTGAHVNDIYRGLL